MKSVFAKKTAGDQNFIGALILVIVAVTIGVLYRNQMSSVMNAGITKIYNMVQTLFEGTGTVTGAGTGTVTPGI